MNTAVQLRAAKGAGTAALRCELFCGAPIATIQGRAGPIAVFGGGELVAYRIRAERQQHLYVFRTLESDDPLAARIPGVRPGVRLLLTADSAGRVRLVQSLFAYFTRKGPAPSGLSDRFWFRMSAVLGGRLPRHKVLVSLLSEESRR